MSWARNWPVILIALLASCGGGGGGGGSAPTGSTYSVGGSISGLTASGLVLANGSDNLVVSANAASFKMPRSSPTGTAYDLVVKSHPAAIQCQIANPSGIIGNSNVTNIAVSCSAGSERILHSFNSSCTSACGPGSGLILGSDGNFYGTVAGGGANASGSFFKISASGVETDLYSFGVGTDGATPIGKLLQTTDGYFYGTTRYGGTNGNGTI